MNFQTHHISSVTDRKNVYTSNVSLSPEVHHMLFGEEQGEQKRQHFDIPTPRPVAGIDPCVLPPTGQIIENALLEGKTEGVREVYHNETTYTEDEIKGVILLHQYFSHRLERMKDIVVQFWSQETIDEIMAQCPNYIIPFLKPYVIYGTLLAFLQAQYHIRKEILTNNIHETYKNCDSNFDRGVLTREQCDENEQNYKKMTEDLREYSKRLSTAKAKSKTSQKSLDHLRTRESDIPPDKFNAAIKKQQIELDDVGIKIQDLENLVANCKNGMRDLLHNWLCNRCAFDTNAGQKKNYHELTNAIFLRLYKSITYFSVKKLADIDYSHRLVIVQGIKFLLSETMHLLCGQPAIAYYTNLEVFKSRKAKKAIFTGYEIFKNIVDEANFIEGFETLEDDESKIIYF